MVTKAVRAGNGPEVDADQLVPPPAPGDGMPGDPFADLASIRLGQDFDAELGDTRLLVRVPVRRPDRQEWVRVRPGSDWRLEVSALEFREDRDWWWAGLGVAALGIYGFAATLQPDAHFGPILAAYGGVFVAGSLAWGMIFDGFRPDRWDVLGTVICLLGVAVIMFVPRDAS